MSGDDVHRNDMDGTFEFDDEAAEALLAGRGAGIDPALSELVGEIRTHFSTAIPAVGLELSTFLQEEPQRYVRSRARLGAKVAAAVAACLAATSGLAVAGALPGPVQHALSRAAGGIGVHVPDQHHGSGQPRVVVAASEETTTTAGTASTTTQPDGDSSTPPHGTHGAEVSAVAHDPSTTGCAHGAAVASVASDKTKTPACVKSTTTTTTTDLAPVTTTTRLGDHGSHGPPVTHGKSQNSLDVAPPTDPPGRSGAGG